jgi:SAM-dependent methyltransferase
MGLCETPTPSKTWDNVLAVEDLLDLDRALPVLDVGCRSGICLVWLNQLGFRSLWGVDRRLPLPPIKAALSQHRLRTSIACVLSLGRHWTRLRRASAEQLPYGANRFAAVTSMSVIEHGVDRTSFLREAHRVLRPGGRLILSTDFWYEARHTTGHLFGPADSILTPVDVAGLLEVAQSLGFEVPASLGSELSNTTPVIEFGGLRYTFLYMSLRKRAADSVRD